MLIIGSSLLDTFPDLIYGMSTKIGLGRTAPFYFNMSLSVGDIPEIVKENRTSFFSKLGLNPGKVTLQKQIHSDIVTVIDSPEFKVGESDALITNQKGIGLAISTADCAPVMIFDKNKKVIAAVHSGWQGTYKKIVLKTLEILRERFDSKPEDLVAYIGPSISQKNYEVGNEFLDMFEDKYLLKKDGKLFLDVKKANLDMLLASGVPESQIQVSGMCSYDEKDILHSYRRDGKKSGRAFAVIALKENRK